MLQLSSDWKGVLLLISQTIYGQFTKLRSLLGLFKKGAVLYWGLKRSTHILLPFDRRWCRFAGNFSQPQPEQNPNPHPPDFNTEAFKHD